MHPNAMRSELAVPRGGQHGRLHVPAHIRGPAAKLPARVHHQLGVRAECGVH